MTALGGGGVDQVSVAIKVFAQNLKTLQILWH